MPEASPESSGPTSLIAASNTGLNAIPATAGYSLAFLVGAVVAGAAAGLGLLLRERPHGAGELGPAGEPAH